MSEVRWHKLRRDEVAAAGAAGAVLLLPIGAVEQHGPHLPLDTDTNATTAVCERAAARLAESAVAPPALVLPPIWWGLSPYWLGFPGTLSLRAETILALVADLGASVARHGFRRLVVVNGHGGNAGVIAVATTHLADAGIRAAALSYWELIGDELRANSRRDGGSIGHAGEVETSIARYLQPERLGELPAAPAGRRAGEGADTGGVADLAALAAAPFADVGYAPPDPAHESPSGVYGDATAGRRELGELTIERAAERLAAFVRHFAAERG